MQEAYEVELEPCGMESGTRIRLSDISQNVMLIAPKETTLSVPPQFLEILVDELNTSDEELDEAHARFDEINQRQINRILGPDRLSPARD